MNAAAFQSEIRMNASTLDLSPKTLARVGGALYVFIIVAGVFGEIFVRDALIVSGNAAATAANVAAHEGLWRLGIAGDLLMHVADLPLLNASEREQILTQWNDTAMPYARDAVIAELFEQQMARTPDAVAIVGARERVTYRELNRRADAIAARLRAASVGADSLVGIFLERTPDLLAAIFGVLKAGGAYVPLDPKYPADRLAFIVEDTRMAVLVTQRVDRHATDPADRIVVPLDLAPPQVSLDEGLLDGICGELTITAHQREGAHQARVVEPEDGVEVEGDRELLDVVHGEGVIHRARHDAVVRTVLAVDGKNGSMTFAGDVPEGWTAQLMRGSFGRLCAGAAEAAQQALASMSMPPSGDSAAILISCIGRRLLMGQRIDEEIEAVTAELPRGSRPIGFYSYGEISPHGKSGRAQLHNQTMTVTLMSEKAA